MPAAAQDFAPFFIQTRDGVRLRAARFETPEPGGVCVLLNGQTEYIEKYFEVIDDLRERGYSVAALDWRGQGGSQRLLDNPRKAHIEDFAQYHADLEALLGQVVAPMAGNCKPIALAHSMGGHILLKYLHGRPTDFSAVVLTAPMIQISTRGVPRALVEAVARFLNRQAPSRDFVWGMAVRDQLTLPFASQIVTSDQARYRRTHDILAADPELRLNGPTWGWLAAAMKSILEISAPGYAEAISTPALILAAGKDRVCDSGALTAFAARMPHAECVIIAGAEHEILMERDIYRDQLWAAFDRFLQTETPRP